MDDRAVDDAIRRYAAAHKVSEAEAAGVLAAVVSAWRQAMAELGVADHPGGQCPAPGCRCAELELPAMVRACELLGIPAGDDEAS